MTELQRSYQIVLVTMEESEFHIFTLGGSGNFAEFFTRKLRQSGLEVAAYKGYSIVSGFPRHSSGDKGKLRVEVCYFSPLLT